MQEFNPNDVRLVAMNLLARREYLRSELARKLSRRFGSRPEGCHDRHIEAVVNAVADKNVTAVTGATGRCAFVRSFDSGALIRGCWKTR